MLLSSCSLQLPEADAMCDICDSTVRLLTGNRTFPAGGKAEVFEPGRKAGKDVRLAGVSA